jgi:hypothetical protein
VPPYSSGGHAVQAHVTELAPQVGGEQVVAVDLGRARQDFLLREIPDCVAQHVDVFAEVKVDSEHSVLLAVHGHEGLLHGRAMGGVAVLDRINLAAGDDEVAAGLQHLAFGDEVVAVGRVPAG